MSSSVSPDRLDGSSRCAGSAFAVSPCASSRASAGRARASSGCPSTTATATSSHRRAPARQFGFTATVYMVADRLGGSNDWDHRPGAPL